MVKFKPVAAVYLLVYAFTTLPRTPGLTVADRPSSGGTETRLIISAVYKFVISLPLPPTANIATTEHHTFLVPSILPNHTRSLGIVSIFWPVRIIKQSRVHVIPCAAMDVLKGKYILYIYMGTCFFSFRYVWTICHSQGIII